MELQYNLIGINYTLLTLNKTTYLIAEMLLSKDEKTAFDPS